jgi:hypothetical protein
MLTSATLGHKHARAYLSIMLENAMIPSNEVISEYTEKGAEYEYINYLTEIEQFIKPSTYSLTEFKQEMTSKSLIYLYLQFSIRSFSKTYH